MGSLQMITVVTLEYFSTTIQKVTVLNIGGVYTKMTILSVVFVFMLQRNLEDMSIQSTRQHNLKGYITHAP